jgi:hypothetical protein
MDWWGTTMGIARIPTATVSVTPRVGFQEVITQTAVLWQPPYSFKITIQVPQAPLSPHRYVWNSTGFDIDTGSQPLYHVESTLVIDTNCLRDLKNAHLELQHKRNEKPYP